MTHPQSTYSIIIPVYKSQDIVARTVALTMEAMESWSLDYEILLVNDGSPDGSWEVIRQLAERYPPVVAVNLIKNYGQHTAVLCGMATATGDYLITMDDDLQNPPSELIKLIDKAKEGYDLVFARFARKQHVAYRKWGTRLINYINGKVFNKPRDITLTNFRIFTKEVARLAVQYRTYYPYIPGLLLMHAHRIGNVLTEHHAREVGGSNYTTGKILKLVARLLFNYSSYPLRVVAIGGILIALLSFLLGIYFMAAALLRGSSVPGWSSLVVILAFFNGILIGLIGMVGIYVSRILRELSSQQAYQVREIVGANRSATAPTNAR